MITEASNIGRRGFLRISLMAGIVACVPEIISCRAKEIAVGSSLPEVILYDVLGNRVTVPGDSAGRITLLHFWASWCKTCRSEMKHLESAVGKYRREGVAAYSIGIGEKKEAVLAYIRNLNVSYPVLVDPDSVTKKRFGIVGIPTYYVLNRQGVVRFKIFGETDEAQWDKIIGTLL